MKRKWPRHGWIGIVLVAVFWTLNWTLPGLRTHWAFFPLWLGYILLVDALAVSRGRTSIITGQVKDFVMLFVVSAPVWWIFEFFNQYVQFWHYAPVESFSNLEYYAYCTLNFSTVIPAVFSTANLLLSFSFFKQRNIKIVFARSVYTRILFFVLGLAMVAAIFIWPRYSMAFLWMSLFFILDPINYWLGNASIIRSLESGDWRPVIVFFAAPLVCGFFWELWNYYSLPKWHYSLPILNEPRIFEMPLAGYLGYLPFGLELFAFVALLQPILGLSYLPPREA